MVEMKRNSTTYSGILADCMGLGKTLMVLSQILMPDKNQILMKKRITVH